MKFLNECAFTDKEIQEVEKRVPKLIKEQINNSSKLVKSNIEFLMVLAPTNYKIAFKNYYDMFLMDSSAFKDIFTKYDQDDLKEKLEKNIAILEHL